MNTFVPDQLFVPFRRPRFVERRLSLMVPVVEPPFTAATMAVPDGTAPEPAADVCVVPSGKITPMPVIDVPAAKMLPVTARSRRAMNGRLVFMHRKVRTAAYFALTGVLSEERRGCRRSSKRARRS